LLRALSTFPFLAVLPLLALIIITVRIRSGTDDHEPSDRRHQVLNDGTIISIAYDRVRPSPSPEVWKLPRLFLISQVLGAVALASSILYLHLLLASHNPGGVWAKLRLPPLSYGEVLTGCYLKVSGTDFLTLFSARTRGWFGSMLPSWQLVTAAVVALAASTTLSAHWPRQLNGNKMARAYFPEKASGLPSLSGVYERHSGVRMASAPAQVLVFTWVYVVVWWLAMDVVKVGLYAVLRHVDKKAGAAAAGGAGGLEEVAVRSK